MAGKPPLLPVPSGSHRWAALGWWAVLLAIPLLSLFGRALLLAIQGAAGARVVYGVIAALLLLSILLWLRRQPPGHRMRHGLHLLWLLPLIGLLGLLSPRPEEGVHVVIFGLFGYLSGLLFAALQAIAVCAAAAGLDEALQWALPWRVGDWRDVLFNGAGALAGMALARVERRPATGDGGTFPG